MIAGFSARTVLMVVLVVVVLALRPLWIVGFLHFFVGFDGGGID